MTRAGPGGIPDDPRILSVLPLVYVAWSDGVLSPSEITLLHDRLGEEPWLDDRAAREFVERWLDPASPPEPEALQEVLRAIRERSAALPRGERRSLARLGMEMARHDAAAPGAEPEGDHLAALERLEQLLGVAGAEATRELVPGAPLQEEGVGKVLAPLPRYRASFRVAELRSILDGEEAELRRRVYALLERPEFRRSHGLSTAEYRERVWRWVRILGEEGLGAVGYPEAHGGSGDLGEAFAVFETLAHHDLSLVVKFGVQFGLFGGSVLQLGTGRHHREYLARIGRAELPGCFAMTETGHGSNVRDIRTTATWDPETEELVVHTPDVRARKDYIGNAALHGRMATVFAQLKVGEDEHGVHAVLVPLRDEEGAALPGVSIEDCGEKEGLNGVDNGRIAFDRVRVPRENLLDRFGSVGPGGTYSSPIPGSTRRFFTMLGTLVAGRISIAAASVCVARTGLTIAVRYGDRRRQFGPAGEEEVPILDYLVHQRRLMPLLATTYGLHFAVRGLMGSYGGAAVGEGSDHAGEVSESGGEGREEEEGREREAREAGAGEKEPGGAAAGEAEEREAERREVESLAAGLKAYASDHAVETLQVCRELCGGQGYLAENRFGRLKSDVDVFTTFEGANPVLLQLVARGLLTGFREEFEEMRIWGVVRQVADRAAAAVSERNPLAARRAGEGHLRDPEFQAGAFRYREERLLRSAALRLRGRIQDGMDSFQAMNEVQDHLVSLARAHVERRILDAFQGAVEERTEGGLRRTLEAVRDLYALSRIEADRGWFLESGYMEGRKARGVRQQVNELCREVRGEARGLVDSFGIPDAILGAPIALE